MTRTFGLYARARARGDFGRVALSPGECFHEHLQQFKDCAYQPAEQLEREEDERQHAPSLGLAGFASVGLAHGSHEFPRPVFARAAGSAPDTRSVRRG